MALDVTGNGLAQADWPNRESFRPTSYKMLLSFLFGTTEDKHSTQSRVYHGVQVEYNRDGGRRAGCCVNRGPV